MTDPQNDPNSAENRIIEAAANMLKRYLGQFREGDFPLTFQFNTKTGHIFFVKDTNSLLAKEVPLYLFDLIGHMVTQSATNIGGMDTRALAEKFEQMTLAVEKRAAAELKLENI